MSIDSPESHLSQRENPALLRVVNALDNLGEPDADFTFHGLELGVKVGSDVWDVSVQPFSADEHARTVNMRNCSAARTVEYRTTETEDAISVTTRASQDAWKPLTTHDEVQPVLDVLYAAARKRRQLLGAIANVQVKR